MPGSHGRLRWSDARTPSPNRRNRRVAPITDTLSGRHIQSGRPVRTVTMKHTCHIDNDRVGRYNLGRRGSSLSEHFWNALETVGSHKG